MNINIFTKKILKVMCVLTFISLVASCDTNDDSKVWNDSAAAVLTKISATDIMVGNEVTISGKYFSSKAENSVSFNGLDAAVVAANISFITAIVPEGAVSGSLTVTSNGKVSNSLPYTIIQPIIPTLISIDPVGGKIGSTVTITGTDFSTTPSENIVRFNGTSANVSAATATTITTTVPAGATTGDITVTRDGESNGLLYTVKASYTLTIQITESLDDVEEASSTGIIDGASSDLELGEFDTTGDPDYGLQTIGLRFPGINLPVGASVLSANIQFTCDAVGAKPVQMTIFGEDVGNSAVFEEEVQYTVSRRTFTSEKAIWDIPEWIAVGDAGLAQQTVDLADIVQKISDRADWTSGNSMSFILTHSGPSIGVTSSSGGREAETSDGSSSGTLAPVLTIIYEK